MQSFMQRAGNDPQKAIKAAQDMCAGPPREPLPKEKYGDGLLLATQKCEGNQGCTASFQNAYIKCYTVGLKEGVAETTSGALTAMLKTCSVFHTADCEESAREIARTLQK